MGFHKGKPLAALIIFRACLQWRSFSADRTGVFDAIFQVSPCSVGLHFSRRW
jgi:myosin-5